MKGFYIIATVLCCFFLLGKTTLHVQAAQNIEDMEIEDFDLGTLDAEDLKALEELESLDMEDMDQWIEDMVGSASSDPNLEDVALQNVDAIASYDANSGLYVFTIPSGKFYATNIPYGGITTNPVTIYPIDGGISYWYSEDEQGVGSNELSFDQPGNYTVILASISTSPTATDDSSITTFNFQILAEETKDVSFIYPPRDFEVSSVMMNQQMQSGFHKNGVFLDKDGIYRIAFKDKTGKLPQWELELIRDTNPPIIEFSENIYSGSNKPPLYIQASEQDAEIKIVYKGLTLDQGVSVLSQGGGYYLAVADEIGNEYSYTVEIKDEGGLSIISVIMIVLGIVGGGATLYLKNIKG